MAQVHYECYEHGSMTTAEETPAGSLVPARCEECGMPVAVRLGAAE